MTQPRLPPDTPPEHLAAWAQDHPDLHAEIAAHPNAYPELIAWIHAQAPAAPAVLASSGGEGPGRRGRRGMVIAVGVTLLALLGGGLFGVTALMGEHDPAASDAPGRGAHGEHVGAQQPSILGGPRNEWRVDVEELVGVHDDASFFDSESDVLGGTSAYLFDGVVIVAAQANNGFHLFGLDVETGRQIWRHDTDGASCTTGRDSAGHDAVLFCRTWNEDDTSRLDIIDPATGQVSVHTIETHVVEGMFVEDDGRVFTYGRSLRSDVDGVEMVVAHGTLDDLDADWLHVLSDSGGDEITHDNWARLTGQGDNWAVESFGRMWVVDKVTGQTHPELASADNKWSTPVAGGGWISETTVHGPDGDPSWDEPAAFFVEATADGEQMIVTLVDEDGKYEGFEVRDTRTGRTLLHVGWGRRIHLTTYDGLVLVTGGDLAQVRDVRTGRTLWHTKSSPVWGRIDDPRAVPHWNTANGMFDMYDRATAEIVWSRDGFPVSRDFRTDVPFFQDTYAVSRDGVLVVVSDHSIHGFTDFGDPPDDGVTTADDPTYVTPCGSPPEFEPVTTTAEDGGVVIEFVVRAHCPGGQWLSGSGVRLVVDDAYGDETMPLADGLFDFSGNPVWIPSDGEARVRARFPIGRLWATEWEIQDAIDRNSIVVECIEDDPASLPEPDDEGTDDVEVDSADPGTSTDEREHREENSLEALQRLAAEDLPYALDEVAGRWVPQLSSKKDGTHDTHDAKTYDYTDIYEQHLELRLRYPGVRLLWSGDWGSFTESNYWVTIAGTTFSTGEAALGWCRDEGFAPSQCYGKLVRTSGPVEDTTRHRKE